MKQTKWELPLFSMYDHTGMERHLEEMAQRGWLLDKCGKWGWIYRRTEPRRVHYAVTYFPKASYYEPGPSEDKQVFQDYCAEAGWELVADWAQIQIFRSEREHPLPIETDAAMQVENVHRAMKGTFLPSYLTLIGVAVLWAVMLLWQLSSDPIGTLTRGNNLFLLVLCESVLFLMGACEITGYYRWRRRARAAAERDGSFTPTRSHRWFQVVLLVIVLIGFLIWLLGSWMGSRRGLVFAVSGVLYAIILILLVNLITRLLKRRGVSAKVNRTVTLVSSFLISFAGIALLGYGVFKLSDTGWLRDTPPADSYELYGMTWEVYADPLPLTVEDLTGQVYPDKIYSYELDRESSFLASRTEVCQDVRLDVEADLPELRYEIITCLPFLYDLCRQDFLDQMTRRNEDIPQEYWDEYRPVDASLWGAEEAYQYYSSGAPRDTYLVCWKDRIVEITFDWAPTAEQIAIAAEKLQNF